MTNVYLNCRANFQDKGNFAAKLTPEAIKELKSKNIEPNDLVGKRIKVRGTIEKTKSNERETGSTHVTVRSADEIEILE